VKEEKAVLAGEIQHRYNQQGNDAGKIFFK
jgi:hypothetical protein